MTQKAEFIKKINEAFATSNTKHIVDNATDDIRWNIIGDKSINGKDEFTKELRTMETTEEVELTVHSIITHGNSASANGTIKMTNKQGEISTYGFSDVYKLSGFKNPKIKEITSYVIKINN